MTVISESIFNEQEFFTNSKRNRGRNVILKDENLNTLHIIELVQQTLDKICKEQDFNELKRTTYVAIAHLWLHKIAEQENLFELEEWSKPEYRDELIKKIEEFLIKHIR